MKDDLGDRMKSQYEDRTRYMLPRRTYTLIRLDGKSFHTYTRGLKKPFDKALSEDIDNSIIAMLPEIQGAVFAYTQSDEISILLTDFATPTTSAWFDGNLQKISSVAASIMTAQFNLRRLCGEGGECEEWSEGPEGVTPKLAYFDARIFTIPDRIEVMNYFIWRNQDCARNSMSMVAQTNFSHKELQGKSTKNMHEMLHAKEVNWATDYTDREKNGALVVKEEYKTVIPGLSYRNDSVPGNPPDLVPLEAMRTRWVSKGAWKFTEDKEKLLMMIPVILYDS